VLLDEVEKAHPDVMNVLLQVLDEGHLTDGQGRRVSFKNCIIIMTSNIGAEIILQATTITEKIRKEVDKLMHQAFKPELLNRIDAVVFFQRLSQETIEKIAKIQLDELVGRLAGQEITLKIEPSVYTEIAKLGYEPEFGARPLKRAIQQHIIVPLSQYRLAHPQEQAIELGWKNDKAVIKS
jgi:ATP-dependent Clp protease ATP-binding subunit ClpB